MKKQKISKNKMATLLETSRTQVDRLLNPKNDITLSSLRSATEMVRRRWSGGGDDRVGLREGIAFVACILGGCSKKPSRSDEQLIVLCSF